MSSPLTPRINELETQMSAENTVFVEGGNGYGSTNTAIRRFDTIVEQVGSAVTYTDSATDGASFTINEDGLYAVSYSDYTTNSISCIIGISLNSNQLTTAIQGLTSGSRIGMVRTSSSDTGVGGFGHHCTVLRRFSAGDVIRAVGQGGGQPNTSGVEANFRITKVL